MSEATHGVSEREQHALNMIDKVRARPPKFRDAQVTMAHGGGGKASRSLVEGLFLPAFRSPALEELDDAAVLTINGDRIAMSTDSYVVRPIRFPGGSIGELAVNGTVNDLAMVGARAQALTLGMVLEEGLGADELRLEVEAIAAAAEAAGVAIAGGDTKVVERGLADQMYITSTGIGALDPRARLSAGGLQPGDHLLVSGPIAQHGVAVMLARGEFELSAPVESDTQPLWPAVEALLEAAGPDIRCMRDATRGGVATVVNELARASGKALVLREEDVPVDATVTAACEILGIDAMYVANEGTFVIGVAERSASAALRALRNVPGFERAADVGEVQAEPSGMVLVETAFGGRRIMDMLVGDPLPRIC